MRFSQRMGIKPIKDQLQIESMDDALRVKLWNIIIVFVFEEFDFHRLRLSNQFEFMFKLMWIRFYNRPIDDIPFQFLKCAEYIKSRYFSCGWYEVYELIEFILENEDDFKLPDKSAFIRVLQTALENECSGYRLVNNQFVQITNSTEINEIEEALKISEKTGNKSAETHLATACSLLFDRKNPNYRNSLKESISAVEAVARYVTNSPKATLGDALKKLDKQIHHTALKDGFSKIYGYASDGDGIRHALIEDSDVDFELAKFMLVSCSAFCNYLVGKSAKQTTV